MDFDVLLIDYRYENLNVSGADLAIKFRQLNPNQVIIFMTGFSDLEVVDAMLKTGVGRTFIRKGGGTKNLIAPVLEVLREMRKPDVEIDTVEEELKRTSAINAMGMVGRSKALHTLALTVENLRQFQSRFLIVGDSGSGKELIAKCFAKGKKFYAVDCGVFDKSGEQFIESQLFGHKRGAYTGADSDMIGAFESAKGGVIFLDELHCLSLGAQSKLLRTLQEGKFRRLGDPSGREITWDAVVVAATQPVIYDMIKDGSFKQDLYFRLARQKLNIPSLAERPDDIRPLAIHFFRIYSEKHNRNREPHPQLLRELESYSWPGNVRVLEGCIDSMVMNSSNPVVSADQFAIWLAGEHAHEKPKTINAVQGLGRTKDTLKTEKIIEALSLSLTVAEAAIILQIARTTLNDRMRRLGIQAKDYLGAHSHIAIG